MVTRSENVDSLMNNASKTIMLKNKWKMFKKKKNEKIESTKRRIHSHYSSDDDDDSQSGYEMVDKTPEMPVISNQGYYWPGKDYANSYIEDVKNPEDFGADQFDRTKIHRMPWRDEAYVVFGYAARDMARHFIQRWNQCKREKVNRNLEYPYLLPKSYQEPYNYNSEWFKDQLYNCDVQITRSMDSWSGGISQTESSIMEAYVDLIKNSKHYIYIENQFFVTTTDPKNDTEVKNEVGRALVDRIVAAHQKREKFRIYVVLPLLPGFDSMNAIQAVQYYNLRSIVLGKFSMYNELKRLGVDDPSEYITFHGMRNWAVLMGELVNEIIYVHSKLMIVDDMHVICGSANINDRSLLGKRDSELAVVITDTEFVNSKFNNIKTQVGKYASSLRQKIFKLHLGIYFNNPDRIDVNDCTCDEFYHLFCGISRNNTHTYEEVFQVFPTDKVTTFAEFTSYTAKDKKYEDKPLKIRDKYQAKKQLESEIMGFIVDFPLKFLSNEATFFPKIHTAEGLVPTETWT